MAQAPDERQRQRLSAFRPTILSEHDWVMNFARFLHQAGVPRETCT
jgi:hypothetical protein